MGWKPATAEGGSGILLPAGTPHRPLIRRLRRQLWFKVASHWIESNCPPDSSGLRSFALDFIELSPGQFDPQGEAYVLCYVGVIAMVVFYISHTGFANRLPLGGKVGRPYGPGRMRASLEDSTAWVIDAPTPPQKRISCPLRHPSQDFSSRKW